MHKRTILLIFGILALSFSFGQTSDAPCASDDLHQERLQTDSVYHRSWFTMEQRLHAMQQESAERNDEIFTIPVVVHVIHIGESIGQGTNISDEQVQSAITALNEDFRKLPGTNGDGDGVDVGIEFCLASRDPEGNPSTGINRVNGSSVPLYATEGIRATGSAGAVEMDVKELSVWPRADYMNVWVVSEIENNNAQGGIQGYAYFPVNSIVDGIVILYNATGTVGNIKPTTALNRTFSHEVGHYLGLYHTFHSTNSCGPEVSCSTQGDRVCDTPPTILSGNCSSPACSGTQQVENYMDYTPETCRNMFSDGQRTRMRNTLLSQRSSILESLGCMSVSEVDAGITEISQPQGTRCDSNVIPVVRLTNFGSENLTACTIHCSVDNETNAEFSWTGNLGPAQSSNVTLPQIFGGGVGEHSFYAWTSSPNGQSDENPNNDESTRNYNITNGSGITLSVTVDFFGSETTWAIYQNGTLMTNGGPYINNSQGSTFEEQLCLGEGCYTLFVYDSYGDGMSFTNGSYELTNADGLVLASGGGNFGLEAEHAFCVDAPVIEQPEPPVANFTASETQGCGSLTVQYTSTSTGSISSYAWSFPGGSPASSNQANPSVTYNNPGDYNVSLTVANESGSDNHSVNNLISIGQGPIVSGNITNQSCVGSNDGSIDLTIDGDGPFTITWNNGANGTNVDNLAPGNYTVSVTDGSNCTTGASFNVAAATALSASLFKTDISCNGEADGSISASANGGVAPYTYAWNNGMQGQSINGLSSGTYSLTLSDGNGCTANQSIVIVEPSAITASVSLVSAESCNGNDGAALANAMGGTGNLTLQWSNGQTGQNLQGVSSGNYTLNVSDANACNVTSGIFIPYDCLEAAESTQLNEFFCGAVALTLDESIVCDPVSNAGMYQWRFTNAATGFLFEGYSTGTNNTFPLEQVTGIAYGTTLNIRIRALNENEIWSEWGPECSIELQGNIPLTQLENNDCNAPWIAAGNMLAATAVAGAHTYQWAFDDGVDAVVFESYLPQLTIPVENELIEGETYLVSVRSAVADDWSDWGSECSLLYGQPSNINDALETGINLSFYPNPSSGENIFLDYRNLRTDDGVIELEVFDGSGKRIENKRLSIHAPHGKLMIHFDRRLSAGIYFLRTRMSGQAFEEKIIVQ